VFNDPSKLGLVGLGLRAIGGQNDLDPLKLQVGGAHWAAPPTRAANRAMVLPEATKNRSRIHASARSSGKRIFRRPMISAGIPSARQWSTVLGLTEWRLANSRFETLTAGGFGLG
jgi:hypothetical protein